MFLLVWGLVAWFLGVVIFMRVDALLELFHDCFAVSNQCVAPAESRTIQNYDRKATVHFEPTKAQKHKYNGSQFYSYHASQTHAYIENKACSRITFLAVQ